MKNDTVIVFVVIASAMAPGLEARAEAQDVAGSVPAQAPSKSEAAANNMERSVQETQPPAVRLGDAVGKPAASEALQEPEEVSQDPSTPTSRPDAADLGEVVVTAERPRGSVLGDVSSERTFSPLEVRAFGVSNIGELIQVLGPQVSSNRGREDSGPVTLLNGRRVSSFAEVARIPTEAIERIDVFPEELALTYGYRADQKVVNIVTFERFKSRTGQITYGLPTEGGRDTTDINAGYFAIRGDTRFNFGADYSRSDALSESDSGVRQPLGTPDLGRFRTLLPETERLTLNGLASGQVMKGVSSTLNGRVEASKSESLLGLGDDGPLARDTETRIVQLGTTQSGRAGRWIWNLTGNYNRGSIETLSDVSDATGVREDARSINTLANADMLLSGPLLELPAGQISTSVRGGVATRDFSSSTHRNGVMQRTEISRDLGVVRGNINVPLFGMGREGAERLGSLSANASIEIERLSDFGTLRTFGYGLNWSPVEAINLIASATHEEGAPTVEQLGAPLIVTPNVRVLDFSRGEVVDVTRVSGGNSELLSDDRHVLSLGLNVKPFARTDFNVGIDYVATRVEDSIAQFPIVTPEIEAAFPTRFTRDGGGRLLSIDGRSINFARSDQQELRWGLNFTRPLGPTPPLPPGMQSAGSRFYPSAEERDRRVPSGVQVVQVVPGSPMARRLENLSSRTFVSLYHTWLLQDEILIREGGTELDLLDGGGIDFRGGSRRHKLELQAGAFKRGLGARLSATWQSGNDVRGFDGAADDLSFSSIATANISLFAEIADQFGGTSAPQWLRGTQATLEVNNLFDSLPEVRDSAGSTPLSYQPAYLDPFGRTVTFSLRKTY